MLHANPPTPPPPPSENSNFYILIKLGELVDIVMGQHKIFRFLVDRSRGWGIWTFSAKRGKAFLHQKVKIWHAVAPKNVRFNVVPSL